jgi:hypothetical protein
MDWRFWTCKCLYRPCRFGVRSIIGETRRVWYDGPMLRAIVVFIPPKIAFIRSTLDVICNATTQPLPPSWSEPISNVRNAQAELAIC